MIDLFQPLYSLIPYLLALFGLALLFKFLNNVFNTKKDSYLPYEKAHSVMTSSEQKYFRQLEQQYAQNYYIFPQVKFDKIVKITDQKNFYTYWNKINKKSIDFVLVDKNTLETVQLIELNDYTHTQAKRKNRDEFLQKVCEKAGITIEFK